MIEARDTHTFQYIECDIAPGVTLDEYRRNRPSPPSLRERLGRRVWALASSAR